MKRTAFILMASLLLATNLQGQSRGSRRDASRDPLVNVGVKAGFNSSMFFIDHLSVGGQELDDIQNNYKVGYFGAFFCRFNLKKHHCLQTEISYNVSKGSISVASTADNRDILQHSALVKTSIHSIDLPVLYGYKFVDARPYGMAFFLGPKVSYNWRKHCKNEYSGFYQQDITEKLHPFCYSAVVGLAVNVSNIFFDFRYEAALHNMVKSVTFDKNATESPYCDQDISLNRRKNVLSFSLGVIF